MVKGILELLEASLWVLRVFCRREFEGGIDEEDLVNSMKTLGIPNFAYISASH